MMNYECGMMNREKAKAINCSSFIIVPVGIIDLIKRIETKQ